MKLLLGDLVEFMETMIEPNDTFIEFFIRWILQFDLDSITAFVLLHSKPEILNELPCMDSHEPKCLCEKFGNRSRAGVCVRPNTSAGGVPKVLVPLNLFHDLTLGSNQVFEFELAPQHNFLASVAKKLLDPTTKLCRPTRPRGSTWGMPLQVFISQGRLDDLNVYQFELLANLRNIVTVRKLERYVPEIYRSTDRGPMSNAASVGSLLSCLYRLHSYSLRYVDTKISEHCFFKMAVLMPVQGAVPITRGHVVQKWHREYEFRYRRLVVSSTSGSAFAYDNVGRKVQNFSNLGLPSFTACEILWNPETQHVIVLDAFILQTQLQLTFKYTKRMANLGAVWPCQQLERWPYDKELDPRTEFLVRENKTGHQSIVLKVLAEELELQVIRPPFSGYKRSRWHDRVRLETAIVSKQLAKFKGVFILTKELDVYCWGLNSILYVCTLLFDRVPRLDFERSITYGPLRTTFTLVAIYFNSLKDFEVCHIEPALWASTIDVLDWLTNGLKV